METIKVNSIRNKFIAFYFFFVMLSFNLSAQTWSSFGTNNLNIAVTTMIVDSVTNTLYVGGNSGVAKWNGSSWVGLGFLSGVVNSLVIYNGELYAGGNLPSNKNIVKWSGTSWTTVTTGTSGPVGALAVYNKKLVVSGSYTTAGGLMTYGIANWDGTTWSNFGSGYPYNPSGSSILKLETINGSLYAAGSTLSMMLSAPYACIGSYNGSTWADASAGANLTMASVYSLAMHKGELYAGGSFTGVANRVAKWNGSGFIPVGTGMDSTVFTLLSYNNELYAGGAFTLAGGNKAHFIAKWNDSTWTEVAGGIGVDGKQPWVLALAKYNSCLVAGGQFTTADGKPAANIAKLCDITTSIMEEERSNSGVEVSPNPFTFYATLQLKTTLSNGELSIYNIYGQRAQIIKNVSGESIKLSRENLQSGIYFIRITQDHETYTTKKIVIRD